MSKWAEWERMRDKTVIQLLSLSLSLSPWNPSNLNLVYVHSLYDYTLIVQFMASIIILVIQSLVSCSWTIKIRQWRVKYRFHGFGFCVCILFGCVPAVQCGQFLFFFCFLVQCRLLLLLFFLNIMEDTLCRLPSTLCPLCIGGIVQKLPLQRSNTQKKTDTTFLCTTPSRPGKQWRQFFKCSLYVCVW